MQPLAHILTANMAERRYRGAKMELTEDKLIEIEDSLRGTTSAVWIAKISGKRVSICAGETQIASVRLGPSNQGLCNAAFIAFAHEAMPALLREVRELRAKYERRIGGAKRIRGNDATTV